jgi:two-component system, NtrC family, sensor kinase
LSGARSPAEFGRIATHQMELLLNFEIATIWRWLPDEELLELTWYSGWPIVHVGLRTASGRGIVGRAIAELKPVQVSAYQESDAAIAAIAAGGLGSGMGVPLVVEGKVIGAISAGHRVPRVYTDSELNLLQVMAGLIAPALASVERQEALLRSQEDLRQQVNSLRAVLASAPVLLFSTDRKGVITQLDGVLPREGDLAAEELVGASVFELCPRDTEAGRAADAALKGNPTRRRAVFDRAGRRWQVYFNTTYDDRKRRIGSIGVAFDVTAEADAASAREESEQKTRYLSMMSHELRTPLNSVIGFAQLLGTKEFGELTARQRRYADNIQASGQHLLAIVDEVLDLAKIQAGQLEINLGSVNVVAVVRRVCTAMEGLAKSGALDIVIKAPAVALASADDQRFAQALMNLVANAVKFTPSGGTVTVQVKRARSGVVVSVCDTGIGIPADQHEHIFEEFAQARSGADRPRDGTGLGLSLSRRLMELMGGSLDLQRSAEGAGSTFLLRLAAYGKVASGSPPDATPLGRKNGSGRRRALATAGSSGHHEFQSHQARG